MPKQSVWHNAPDMIPPGQYLGLGRLFENPRNPTEPWKYGRVSVHDHEIHKTSCPCHISKGATHGQSLGISTSSYLSFMGVMNAKAKADARGEVRTNKQQFMDIEKLEIKTFELTLEHEDKVMDLVQKAKERQKLRKSKDGEPKHLYMIMGTQTAYGGETSKSRSAEWNNSASVEAKPAGLKVVKGGVGQTNSGKKHSETSMGRHDFIYAFTYKKVYSRG